MNLDSILKYQQIDIKLFKIENELRGSEEYKNLALYKKLTIDAKDMLFKLDKKSEDIILSFNTYEQQLKDLTKEAEDISNMLSGIDQIDEFNYHFKNLEKINSNIAKLENSISQILDDVRKINSQASKMLTDGRTYNAKYKEAFDKFNELKESRKAEVNELQSLMSAIEKNIDSDVLAHYKRLKDAKKIPCIVPYNPPCCSGCGMEVDNAVKDKLKQNNIAECPNCNRVIYSNNN